MTPPASSAGPPPAPPARGREAPSSEAERSLARTVRRVSKSQGRSLSLRTRGPSFTEILMIRDLRSRRPIHRPQQRPFPGAPARELSVGRLHFVAGIYCPRTASASKRDRPRRSGSASRAIVTRPSPHGNVEVGRAHWSAVILTRSQSSFEYHASWNHPRLPNGVESATRRPRLTASIGRTE
jgi:hypothetical protein